MNDQKDELNYIKYFFQSLGFAMVVTGVIFWIVVSIVYRYGGFEDFWDNFSMAFWRTTYVFVLGMAYFAIWIIISIPLALIVYVFIRRRHTKIVSSKGN